MHPDSEGVRPTKRAIGDLGLDIPDLGQMLHKIKHAGLQEMQKIPERALAQGLERIRSLTDRTWFKFKSGTLRAAATKLPEKSVPAQFESQTSIGRWWIGACGARQADSAQHDFYSMLEAEFGRKKSSTDHLLPQEWDFKRLEAELALRWLHDLRQGIVDMIAKSLLNGKMLQIEANGHYIIAGVRATSREEAYLIVGAAGIPDVNVLAIMLSAVPGVSKDEWLWEPLETIPSLGVVPKSGELIWSTLLSPEIQAGILEAASPDVNE